MKLFIIHIPSKQITYCYNSFLYAFCRFVGWDLYFFNIEELSKSVYMYMTIDNPTFLTSLVNFVVRSLPEILVSLSDIF